MLDFEHRFFSKQIQLKRTNRTFYATLCIVSKSYEELINKTSDFLHPKEYVYSETLGHKNRKYSYLLGRYCAKQALSTEPFSLIPNQYAITSGIFGQPIVNSSKNIQVSIAHGRTLGAAIAFPEEHPMGIDIEPMNESNLDVIQKEMTVEELALMSKYIPNKTQAATILWTAKEAIAKVMRTGFMVPFQLFEISSCTIEGDFIYTHFKNFHQYQAASFQVQNHMCSVVYPRATKMMLD